MPTFVTSRGSLPENIGEGANRYWFNLWRYRLWPYSELQKDDFLLWYDSQVKAIVWKTRVVDVDRFEYERKSEIAKRIRKQFGYDPSDDPYLRSAGESGYCLAFEVRPIAALNLPKPVDFDFPRGGWLRSDAPEAHSWLAGLSDSHASTPEAQDLPAPKSNRIATTIYRILRDTVLAKRVKEMHRCKCQICGMTITLPDGTRYAEAHHIQPLGEPHNGPDVIGNILCLCPNHHAELDYGVAPIKLAALRRAAGHVIERQYVDYHNRRIVHAD